MDVGVLALVFFALILIGAPIAVALGGSALATAALYNPIQLTIIGQKVFSSLDHFTLMAVPFFFFAAAFMESGGLVKRLIAFANALVGHLKGGLGMTAVLTCVFFAAISGSSPATVAAVGNMMYPALTKAGYSPRYAIGALSTAGSIGILIPPSIPMIIYGFVTETSIVGLFIAGIIPGLIYGAAMMVVARVLAHHEGHELRMRADRAERKLAFRSALPALTLPFFIIVGIYGFPKFTLFGHHFDGGAVFTPTEAAIVATLLALLIGIGVYRELGLDQIPRMFVEASTRVGTIFWVATNAILFGYVITKLGVPQLVTAWITSLGLAQWQFLALVNVLLMIVGLFMEGVPTILIFAPILFPAAQAMGVDPIHFGVIMVVNIELGLITPPVGLNLFVGSTISGLSVLTVFRATLPWMIATIFTLLLVTYVPQVTLFLPHLMKF